MTADHQLDATWAISSKTPGQAQGYEIKCAPEDHSIAARLRTMAEGMGTPAGQQTGRRDTLPWFTFTGGGTVFKPMVALAFIDWSDERDGTHQPITPARALWLPWETVVAARLDHRSFWRGVTRLHWPHVDRGPGGASEHRTAVFVPPRDHHRIVDEIERLGFDFLARIAAHLVDGHRVALVLDSGDSLTTAERVAALDAVLALLPFGARNCLTVATWASYKASHDMPLAFSDHVRSDQIGVPWHSRSVEPPQARGRAYLSELQRLADDGHRVRRIVDHLATKTTPLRHITEFDLAELSEIRFASDVYEKIFAHTASIDQVIRAVEDPAATGKQEEEFGRFLARSACSAVNKEAKKAREFIITSWRPTFARSFAHLCRTGEQLGKEPELIWLDLCRDADKKGEDASKIYLTEALHPPEISPADHRVMSALGSLVLEYLTATKTIDENIYRLLVTQPHVLVRALSGMLLERPNTRLQRIRNAFRDNIKHVVASLRQHSVSLGPAWLRPILLAAQAQPDAIDPKDVEALAALGHRAFSCFVDLVAHHARQRQSIDLSWTAVVHLLNSDFENTRHIVTTLLSAKRGKHELPSPEDQARIDILGMLSDAPGHRLELGMSALDDRYITAFQQTLKVLVPRLQTLLCEGVVLFLDLNLGSVSPLVVQRLEPALGRRLVDGYLNVLSQRLAAGRVREVLALDLPRGLLEPLIDRPGLDWFRSLHELGIAARNRVDVTQVAPKAIDALRASSAIDEVIEILFDYAGTVTAVELDKLLRRLHKSGNSPQIVTSGLLDRLSSADAPWTHNFVAYVEERRSWYKFLSLGAEGEGTR